MKVKKIIAALLASVCVFSFFSCVEETTSSEWVNYTLGKDKRTYSVSGCALCAAQSTACCCDCHYSEDGICEECSYECVVADRYLYIDRYQKWPVESIAMNAFAAKSDLGITACPHIHTLSMSDYITTISNFAFSGCANLESVILGKNVSKVDSGAFKDCKSLTTLVLNKNYTSVKSDTFLNCSSLTSLDLTFINEIEMNAFAGCESLEYVILGNGISKIGQNAFTDEDEDLEFFFLGTPEEWEAKCNAHEIVNKKEKYYINRNMVEMITPFIYYYSAVEPDNLGDTTSNIRYWSYYDGVPTPW